jgi:hypothetical protein
MKSILIFLLLTAITGCQYHSANAILKDKHGNIKECNVRSYGLIVDENEGLDKCISSYEKDGYQLMSKK